MTSWIAVFFNSSPPKASTSRLEISDEELLQIEKKYPIIANLNKKSTYKVLLKSPFYINLINTTAVKKVDEERITTYNFETNKLLNIW